MEQPLPSRGSCLLGSMLLTSYVKDPFTSESTFDYVEFEKDVRIANRFLDNIVEINRLPVKEYDESIRDKRRHGLGILGLGSMLQMIGVVYGSHKAMDLFDKIMKCMAKSSYDYGIELAAEKGCAPAMLTKEARLSYSKSVYFDALYGIDTAERKKFNEGILQYGIRYTHAISIAPTGTMSFTWGDNCSNGIEPVFAYGYLRNIRVRGKNTKTQEALYDVSLLRYKEMFPGEIINGKPVDFDNLPLGWADNTADRLSYENHIDMQAIAQKYVDSAVSKCVTKGTLLCTDKGIFRIEDLSSDILEDESFGTLNDNYKILDKDGALKKITSFYKGGSQRCAKVSFNNGQSINCAYTHKLGTPHGWRSVGYLNVGDKIFHHTNLIRVDKPYVDILHSPVFESNTTVYNLPSVMNENYARFIGIFLADGFFSDNSIGITERDDDVIRIVGKLFVEVFGKSASVSINYKNGNRNHIFYSRAIARYYKHFLGADCLSKKIPDEILQSKDTVKIAFLEGIAVGGHMSKDRIVFYEGCSPEVANGIKSILSSFGVKHHSESKSLQDGKVSETLYSIAGLLTNSDPLPVPVCKDNNPDEKKYLLHKSMARHTAKGNIANMNLLGHMGLQLDGGLDIVTIVDIVDIGMQDVYDIEVEDSHSYLIDGVVSHNTINIATDTPFEEFKSVYEYAFKSELKGCTTFRFNPETLGAVLVTEQDLKNTMYRFTTDTGEIVTISGEKEVKYNEEVVIASNLFDALKENIYGKM